MAKPFDATVKHLLETYPADWLKLIGSHFAGPVVVRNSDLSTITSEADKVLQIGIPPEWLLHIEIQSNYKKILGQVVLRYNVLVSTQHNLPVLSVVVLLRPEADGPAMTGLVENELSNGRKYLNFNYDVVRIWELPPEALLAGGLGTLPLALLTNAPVESLPGVVRQMQERLSAETGPAEEASLWTAAYILMGLKYPRDIADQLLQGVQFMKESVTYQAILEEGEAKGIEKGIEKGRANEARTLLLLLGTRRFGPPTHEFAARINAISGADQLESMATRLLDVSSWEELCL